MQVCGLLEIAQQALVSEEVTRPDWSEEDGSARNGGIEDSLRNQ
jgi:hypothetical protein